MDEADDEQCPGDDEAETGDARITGLDLLVRLRNPRLAPAARTMSPVRGKEPSGTRFNKSVAPPGLPKAGNFNLEKLQTELICSENRGSRFGQT